MRRRLKRKGVGTQAPILSRLSANVAAAYGLRQLAVDFKAAPVYVRRIEDNATMAVGFDANGNLDEVALMNFVGGENLVRDSGNMAASSWIKMGLANMAPALAPNGTMTAWSFTETATNERHGFYQGQLAFLRGTNTFSLSVKPNGRNRIKVIAYGTGMTAAVVTSSPVATYPAEPNGFYRVPFTFNCDVIPANGYLEVWLYTDAGEIYMGDAVAGMTVWGMQLNRGAVALDYCPTTSVPRTCGQNFLLYSDDLTQSAWVKRGTTVTAGIAAPDGTNTAFRIDNIGEAATGDFYQSYTSAVTGKKYTGSIWIQPVTTSGSLFVVNPSGGQGGGMTLDLAAIGTGWVQMTTPMTGITNQTGLHFYRAAGASTLSVNVWHPQVNEGSAALPYTATAGAVVNTGSAYVTRWYDQAAASPPPVTECRDLIQTAAVSQPQLVFAGKVNRLGKRPAVVTDGIDDNMATDSFTLNQPYSRMSTLQVFDTPSAYANYFTSLANASPVLYRNSANTLAMKATNGIAIASPVAPDTKATVVETYNGTASSGSVNGTPTGAIALGTDSLDGLLMGGGGTDLAKAAYGGVIITTTSLSDADRRIWEADAKAYYNL